MRLHTTDEFTPGRPYWWDGLPDTDLKGQAPDKVDILVIGAGYTGLSAALHAHDGGASVAILDAGQPGALASSRNGGMFGAHPRLGHGELTQKFGADTADALFAEANPAMNFVRDLMLREGIECDYQQTGRIQLAWSKAHFQSQCQLARDITAKSDVKTTIVPREDLHKEIATGCYYGGITFPEHGAINPRKFHAGLLRAVQNRGIPIAPNTPATGLKRQNGGFVVSVPGAQIQAEKVILATNGYTRRPFHWHRARVFGLPSYLIATEPLPKARLKEIAPTGRMMVETRARHSYFRISPDGTRIIWGGRAAMVEIDLIKAAHRLRSSMVEVWPSLMDVKISHIWCGNTGYSFNHMPHVGQDRGLHYALGFSGSGTVMAPYLGAKAVFQALGDQRGETAYKDTTLTRHWMHPFERPYFLKAADFWYRSFVDRRDSWAGRR